jgi:hypothetical protein
MSQHSLKVNDDFEEIDTRTVDERNRITLGELITGTKRIRLYKNSEGEILLIPLIEIPRSEVWLFQNKDALASVQQGLKDAASGKVSKLKLQDFS